MVTNGQQMIVMSFGRFDIVNTAINPRKTERSGPQPLLTSLALAVNFLILRQLTCRIDLNPILLKVCCVCSNAAWKTFLLKISTELELPQQNL